MAKRTRVTLTCLNCGWSASHSPRLLSVKWAIRYLYLKYQYHHLTTPVTDEP